MIKGFKIICKNCGSEEVEVNYNQGWETEYTSVSPELTLMCKKCLCVYDMINEYYYPPNNSVFKR